MLKRFVLVAPFALSALFVTACAQRSVLPSAGSGGGTHVTQGKQHVMTGDYLSDLPNLSEYAPYLTYAFAQADHMGALRKMDVRTLFYTNPLQPICRTFSPTNSGQCASGDYQAWNLLAPGGRYNSLAARDCAGNLITGYYTSGDSKLPALFLDPTKPGASEYLQAVLDAAIASINSANPSFMHAWTQLVVDNDTPVLYNPNATPCSYNAATWTTATTNDLDGTTDGPYEVNSLGFDTIAGVQQALASLNASTVTIGEYEECYGANAPSDMIAKSGAVYSWDAIEYAEIHTIALGKTFWCYVRLSGDGASYIPFRIYTYASFLLSYDFSRAIIEEALSGGPSGLAVFPEWQLVPLQPKTTASDVSGYQLTSGAYLREWAQCLNSGVDIGPCAVAVNPSQTATVPVPTGYTRHVVLSGAGVLDGGSLSIATGVPTTLPPATAQILFP